MKTTYPLVSCIMPTANREKFVPYAIQYFLRQDYPNKELVIVDDGKDSVESLIPQHPTINYVRLMNPIATVGEKRNYACSISKGEIIAHWDDDDWYAANWLRLGMDALLRTGSDLCGLSNVIFYSPLTKKSWTYVYPPNERPWVCGATMMYKKDLWKNNPFKPLRIGEDNSFVWNARGKVFAHSLINNFVAFIHPGNTSKKLTNSRRWVPLPLQEVVSILNSDLTKYQYLN
jgi:glycosyltransferase involved in cell wall biosynthesis